jgi:hypothetical protein
MVVATCVDAVPEVGLLDTDTWWEWALRMKDLLIYEELSECIVVDGEILTEEEGSEGT